MSEFLIFKATPWVAFLILFLSLKDRTAYYLSKPIRRNLTVAHYHEIRDSRIILGINTLFYATNLLPLFISFCHILLHHVSDEILAASHISLVANSTFKLSIYLLLSHDFRTSSKRFLGMRVEDEDFYHWMEEEENTKKFLGHAKVATFVQTHKGREGSGGDKIS